MTDDECDALALIMLSAAGQDPSIPDITPIITDNFRGMTRDEIEDYWRMTMDRVCKERNLEFRIPLTAEYKRLRRIVAVRLMLGEVV